MTGADTRPRPARVLVVEDDPSTARTIEKDRVGGLELGADDNVPKPFSPRELVARVRAVLRRRPPAGESPPLRCGALTVDRERHSVTVDGRERHLSSSELALLAALHADVAVLGRLVADLQELATAESAALALEPRPLRVAEVATAAVAAVHRSGAGIGLAIVHRLVEAHGGRVAITSEHGWGSCFSLSLPAHEEA